MNKRSKKYRTIKAARKDFIETFNETPENILLSPELFFYFTGTFSERRGVHPILQGMRILRGNPLGLWFSIWRGGDKISVEIKQTGSNHEKA